MTRHHSPLRRAFTMVELMLAMAIMGMVLVAVGTLTQAVHHTNEYTQAVSTATQHARVAMQRVSQTVAKAYATADEPGCALVETVDTEYFPQTLVVWAPNGNPANLDGPPLVGEFVIYTPNPNDPMELWELTAPGDSRTQSLASINSVSGRALIASLKASGTTVKRTVTTRLRTVSLFSQTRPILRFTVEARPTVADWAAFQAGTLAWDELPWPQSLYGNDWGVRATRVKMEMWMSIAPRSNPDASAMDHAIPFFSSATFSHRLAKTN